MKEERLLHKRATFLVSIPYCVSTNGIKRNVSLTQVSTAKYSHEIQFAISNGILQLEDEELIENVITLDQ